MCLNPIFSNGNKFACRSCNECVETRLNDWVVRALAESDVAGYTYALTLTYADLPTGEKPVGAIVFDYRDVKLFLKRLRGSYERHYGDENEIRYLACGEQGSKGTQRVHWHVILFSEKDIRPAIKWADFQTRSPVAPSQVVTDSNYLVDVWPNGHIHLQKPDAKGIRYALKYVLKEQSGISKSSGTNRLPRAELWAASFFRMSKKPPIGLRYLRDLVHTLARQGKVYPSMRVHVPSSNGFWYLNGYFAQYWCGAMAQINIDVKAATGASPHGWGALLSAVEEHDKVAQNGKLLEVLTYGSWKSKGPEFIGAQDAAVDRSGPSQRAKSFACEVAEGLRPPPIRAEVAGHAVRARHWDTIGRCGGFAPCAPCQRGFSEGQRERYERDSRTRQRSGLTKTLVPMKPPSAAVTRPSSSRILSASLESSPPVRRNGAPSVKPMQSARRLPSVKKNASQRRDLPKVVASKPLVIERREPPTPVVEAQGLATSQPHRDAVADARQPPTFGQPIVSAPLDKEPLPARKCKDRPDSREARKGKGGSRPFIPWCKG